MACHAMALVLRAHGTVERLDKNENLPMLPQTDIRQYLRKRFLSSERKHFKMSGTASKRALVLHQPLLVFLLFSSSPGPITPRANNSTALN
ncbi:hypothetical protein ON010_g16014 [Phytophthora cinnamomi]|nr:hypothetical protein ON010_g16014 [Phytophthora cinnamomi]